MSNLHPKFILAVGGFIFFISQSGKAQDATPQVPAAYSTNQRSFIRTWDATAPINDPAVLTSRPVQDVKQTTQYLDGLGRPLQTVVKQGSLSANGVSMDVVSAVVYDEFGREVRQYLPFVANSQGGNTSIDDGLFKINPFQQQQYFYSDNNITSPIKGQGETFYYGKTEYEASPLNRPERTYSPGNSWVNLGNGKSTKYWTNTAIDEVRIWKVTNNQNGFGSYTTASGTDGIYAAGELYKNVTINEKGNQVIEFKDKNGLLILKKVQLTATADNGAGTGHANWLCTYFIYDNFNLLRAIVQPKGVELWEKGGRSSALSDDILNELCFRYEYDAQRRMVIRKMPGAGDIKMIYDNRDRLVFTQDANMGPDKWLATLYDHINRPVITGFITWAGTAAELQTLVTRQTTTGIVGTGGTGATGGSGGTGGAGATGTQLYATLTLDQPNTSGTYKATESITLNPNFSTTAGDIFTAEIVTGGTGSTGSPDGGALAPDNPTPQDNNSFETVIEGMAITNNPIPGNAVFTLLTKSGFDNYNTIPSASGLTKTIDNTYTGSDYLNTAYQSFPYPEPVTQSFRTNGMITWMQTKILGTSNQYLYSVMIYDEKGRGIQVKGKNNTNGTDISTNQFTFSGQPYINIQRQEKIGSANPQTHIIVTKSNYNSIGQLTGVTKKISSLINGVPVDKPEVEILANKFDALGRLIQKGIGKKKDDNGNYTSDPLQSLIYDFNIRGWLLGVNRSYLETEGQTSDGTVFGFELGYDKYANKAGQLFNKRDFGGNITGVLWKSDGDDIRRKYDFSYDAVNRLMAADFVQQNRDDHQWNNSKVNFNVRMGDGTLDPLKAYDANGNILRMQQWGVKVTGIEQIDNLVYHYYKNELSNKLMSVSDNMNGKLGDFTDNNSIGNDYGYDANGNMVTDLNKGIKGSAASAEDIMSTGGAISYNHLNLPEEIVVKGDNNIDKGTIKYVYDALGNKLQKIVTENNGTTSFEGGTYFGSITTTTTYLGNAVYESKAYGHQALASLAYTDKLQFLGHEEGRVRFIPKVNDVPAHYEYDYFIKDHLGNVRIVLTEQKEHHNYIATMERGSDNKVRTEENKVFSNLDASEYLTKSVPDGYPEGTSVNDPNLYVARVNGYDHKKGPSLVLRVMAGDVVDVGVNSFYRSKEGGGTPGNALNDILSSLAEGIVSSSGVVKGTLSDLSNSANSPLLGALNSFRGERNQDMPSKPKAYLNWILLDEQFKYVETYPQSNAIPVGDANKVNSLALKDIDITKNGYLYVYVSNETENWDVYFDDLAVTHHTGALTEETHYYPFGLTMAGISSKALGPIENKRRFNGIEQNTDLDLNMYDAFFRTLDPQTGRWWQVDPKPTNEESVYAAMANNPVLRSDFLGDSSKKPIHGSMTPLGAKPFKMNASYKNESRLNYKRNQQINNNADPVVSFTAAVTRGSFGIRTEIAEMGFEVTGAFNENDIVGLRDNEPVVMGKTKDGKATYRTGASYSLAGFGGEYMMETESRVPGGTARGKNKTLGAKGTVPFYERGVKVDQTGHESWSSTSSLFSFKLAAYVGVEVEVSLNLPDIEVIGAERNIIVSESTQVFKFIPQIK